MPFLMIGTGLLLLAPGLCGLNALAKMSPGLWSGLINDITSGEELTLLIVVPASLIILISFGSGIWLIWRAIRFTRRT